MLADYNPRRSPFLHQTQALEAGWQRPGFAYFLEMGLGKTRVLIDNFCMLHNAGRVDGMIVVAPKGVYTNWSRVSQDNPGELQSWMWDGVREAAHVYTWRSGKSKRERGEIARLLATNSPGVRVLVVNVEAVSLMGEALDLCVDFMRAHRTMLVIDESTIIKNPASARTKAMLKLSKRAPYRRILTGSPITGSPVDVFPQMEFVEPGCLGHRSFYTFRERYCVLKEISVGGRTLKTEVGVRNMDELALILKKNSFRARKRECLDLPDKIYESREVEMSPEQTRVYEEMSRHALAILADESQVSTQLVITQMMRLHQIVCGHVPSDDGRVVRLQENRTSALMDIVEASDESTVIWCNYKSDIRAVENMLRTRYGDEAVAGWHGDVPQALRENGETDFQSGRRRFMVASQQSGGRGRTWTTGTLVIYYSNNHDLELRLQSEDRTHRIGQRCAVTYVDLVSRGTVDEKIVKALLAKDDVARAVMLDGPGNWLRLAA